MQLSRDDLFNRVEELETRNIALKTENLALKEKNAKLTKTVIKLTKDNERLEDQVSEVWKPSHNFLHQSSSGRN